MDNRPASLLAATVLVALTGVSALLVAALLMAVAAGAVAFLDDGLSPFAWLVAGSAFIFGLAGVAAAVGLWRQQAWAWPVAAGVQALGTLGAAVAIATSGPQTPTLIGTAMVAAGLAAVIAPDTRRSLAI
jgi:hypothetical protein